ncbi:Uncharacterized protein PECH_007686 [Penicillium ucsense]|uniref:Sodium/calcium exchanger membrane region domain-containing protein n=1 Tax=Penicillium ucsense TaxID=2839758 RepID=A0A8J8W418_9EURO|nr:Uncharacterized protein PECM_003814 [Penicillium ucsense]KAF7734749.1 Uncharacterized protein PECH_007686 [Penicillium ucsense]
MHKYRREARQLAWYDQDGEPSSHNPFKKFRRRPQRTNSMQLEDQLVHSRSMGDVNLSQDRRRRAEFNGDIEGPAYAGTFPPVPTESYEPAPSNRSDEPINDPATLSNKRALDQESVTEKNQNGNEAIESTAGQTRQRKGLFGKFGRHKHDEETPASEPDDEKPVDGPKFTFASQIRATILNSWINVLILAAPVGIALFAVGVNPIAVFVVNFIAIIPLAAMLSYATEEIAMRTGETIGGLLNASFGNAVELIVAIIALQKRNVLIVQTSLIGSMLSNLLLVMGMCFFFGGINRVEQHFNVVVAQTAASLLSLAVASLIIPTAFHQWSDSKTDNTAAVSRGTAVLLLVTYGCYLFFQLKSHIDMYNAPSKKVEKRNKKSGDASRGIARIGKMTARLGAGSAQEVKMTDGDDEPEEPQLALWVAILTLGLSTALVAVCAEFMVDSIEPLTATGGISETFVGLILLPIVGNAAEHATAVTVACKDKMDLAIGVAVGSSMQIALLVLPFIVVLGWCEGINDMTLNFDSFEIILLFVSVLLVNYLIGDGKSHWLEGVLLMMMYLIIALAAWFF